MVSVLGLAEREAEPGCVKRAVPVEEAGTALLCDTRSESEIAAFILRLSDGGRHGSMARVHFLPRLDPERKMVLPGRDRARRKHGEHAGPVIRLVEIENHLPRG